MLYPKNQKGFTVTELVIVMTLGSFLVITLFVFTSGSINSFMGMQAESLARSKLSDSSFRVTRVIRGIDYIETANTDTITAYSYFAPHDQYTSKIRYYLNATNDKLMADVTPMTADYPIGTLISSKTKTVTIVDKFYKVTGSPTFIYYDSGYTILASPVSDVQAIKNISVVLHVKKYDSSATDFVSNKITVNLRNRKSNL